MEKDKAAAEIYVSGRVQGVGYRFFTESAAARYGIKGWSKNLADGRVMLEVEGDRRLLDRFIKELEEGPRMARVEDVSVSWTEFEGRYDSFFIKF